MARRASTFPGFSKRMQTFFRQLEKNNEREWFAAHKEVFEEYVRGPMVELVGRVNDALRGVGVEYCVGEPAKALYRIYRDTRFSKDKTPYKDHIAATFHYCQLPRNGGAGLYFSVNHKVVEIAGGVYLSDPTDFAALRAAIAKDPEGFVRVVEEKKVTRAMGRMVGEKYRRLPRGYEGFAGTRVEEYLKHKQLYWFVEVPAAVALTSRLQGEVVRRFGAMVPALGWMNRAMVAARAAAAEGERPVRPEPMF